MKHIFIINSHTTFLSSIGTINYLNLCNEDIYLIYVRYYKNSIIEIPYKHISFNEEFFHSTQPPFKYNPKRVRNLITKLDEWIEKNIHQSYMLYAPHVKTPFFQIFATNQYCKGIHLIQEGAYGCFPSHYSFKEDFLYGCFNSIFRYNKRIWLQKGFWIPNFLKKKLTHETYTYSIYPEYFQLVDEYKNIKISWPKVHINYELKKERPIFVFESAVEMTIVDKKTYMNAVEHLVSDKAEEINYVKFHPNQNPQNIEEIKNIFKSKKKNIVELPKDIPFELFLSSYDNLKVCGFTTSLIIFSKLMGHSITSYVEDLCVSKTFRKYLNSINYDFNQLS